MKHCRHCGTENEDGALTCIECELSLSPSPAAQLLARLPSALRTANKAWLWRAIVVVAVPLLVLAVYLLSLGPILRFYGAKPSSAWSRVPPLVRAVYQPLDKMPVPESLGRMLRSYNRWWMGADNEKADFIS